MEDVRTGSFVLEAAGARGVGRLLFGSLDCMWIRALWTLSLSPPALLGSILPYLLAL